MLKKAVFFVLLLSTLFCSSGCTFLNLLTGDLQPNVELIDGEKDKYEMSLYGNEEDFEKIVVCKRSERVKEYFDIQGTNRVCYKCDKGSPIPKFIPEGDWLCPL